jgi:hypothetical protein
VVAEYDHDTDTDPFDGEDELLTLLANLDEDFSDAATILSRFNIGDLNALLGTPIPSSIDTTRGEPGSATTDSIRFVTTGGTQIFAPQLLMAYAAGGAGLGGLRQRVAIMRDDSNVLDSVYEFKITTAHINGTGYQIRVEVDEPSGDTRVLLQTETPSAGSVTIADSGVLAGYLADEDWIALDFQVSDNGATSRSKLRVTYDKNNSGSPVTLWDADVPGAHLAHDADVYNQGQHVCGLSLGFSVFNGGAVNVDNWRTLPLL